ncbi:RDD family protein [Flavobacterium piscis]|uniref:RDD family membrane protein YckC n=1 Tax=Flavobacterium piscis TaxID=1114874 RepID=A0ABU1Y2D6_9FLAO|nr:RDD family protein [Flavobacterium piscis]MDR7208218.1 putative RDD family membrane protein YckC [Flavobacterium piscis]
MNDSVYILDEELLASNNKRFLNYVLDHIFFVVLLILIGVVLGILISLFNFTSVSIWIESLGDLGWNCVVIIISISYYTLFESLSGRTLGKLITGTIVVNENGKKPDFGTVFKRSLCRLIPFNAFSFLFNPGLGWHDSISDTYVVDKKSLEESLKMFNDFKLIGVKETEE